MRKLLFLYFLVVAFGSKVGIEERFETFAKQFGRIHSSEEEKAKRFDVFRQNIKLAEEVKISLDKTTIRRNTTTVDEDIEINQFFDWFPEELASFLPPTSLFGEAVPANQTQFSDLLASDDTLPESFDLRKYGYVSEVKDQATCGACYAFTAAAVLEISLRSQNKGTEELSEQSILDCCYNKYCSNGCKSGSLYASLLQARYFGISKRSDYPYKMAKEECDKSKKKFVWAQNVQYESTEIAIKRHMYQNKAAAGVNIHAGNLFALFSSKNEVILGQMFCPSTEPNHSVTIVGWGTSDGVRYWICKNSWGTDWGTKGYFNIQIGLCGMTEGFFAQVSKSSIDPIAFPIIITFFVVGLSSVVFCFVHYYRSRRAASISEAQA